MAPDANPLPTANFDQDLGVAIVRRALTQRADPRVARRWRASGTRVAVGAVTKTPRLAYERGGFEA